MNMTEIIKEIDGSRSMEVQERDGVVFFDDGRFCLHFDKQILIRAIERELGVAIFAVSNNLVGHAA